MSPTPRSTAVFPNPEGPEPMSVFIINAVPHIHTSSTDPPEHPIMWMIINSLTAFINASVGVGVASDVIAQAMINGLLAAVWVRGYGSRYGTSTSIVGADSNLNSTEG